MPIRLSKPYKCALLSTSVLVLTGCAASKYTPAEQEMVDTMGVSQYQPRTQLERDAVETQDLFAQAAFWSREYDLNPGDLEAAMKLSSTLRKMGNPSQALEIAKTARALYPRDTNLLAEYAAGLVALEQGKQAISPLSRAVRQDPNNARLWSLMGASHDQIGQFNKARDYYGRALALTPNDSNILANVGLSYALEGDARTAEIWLRRAAQNPNASAHVRQNLALVLGLQGKYDEAETLAREDLNSDGAENNLAYLKSLRGGGRTYEALAQPQPPASQPAQRPAPQTHARSQHALRPTPVPTHSRAPVRPVPAAPTQSYLPQTAPNVSIQSGGAREAAMAAARRMQENGGAKRTLPMSQSEIATQQDVLSRIGQSVAPKRAPITTNRPTYAQMQARAAQINQQAQAQADAEARAAAQQAQMRAAQNRTGTPYYQGQQPQPPQYAPPQGYRAPARRRE